MLAGQFRGVRGHFSVRNVPLVGMTVTVRRLWAVSRDGKRPWAASWAQGWLTSSVVVCRVVAGSARWRAVIRWWRCKVDVAVGAGEHQADPDTSAGVTPAAAQVTAGGRFQVAVGPFDVGAHVVGLHPSRGAPTQTLPAFGIHCPGQCGYPSTMSSPSRLVAARSKGCGSNTRSERGRSSTIVRLLNRRAWQASP